MQETGPWETTEKTVREYVKRRLLGSTLTDSSWVPGIRIFNKLFPFPSLHPILMQVDHETTFPIHFYPGKTT
jgi:hypothetical protein